MRGGDTLQGIAAGLYGDSSLWYKIAQANGLSGESTLIEGTTLRLPAGVTRNSYNASTFKPYDPAAAIGDTAPTAPEPPKNGDNGKCGTFGQILLAVIAVAVTIIAAPLGTLVSSALTGTLGATAAGFAGAATVGAVASTVSQAVGVVTGIQEKFSWKSVGISALTAGFGKGGVNLGGSIAKDIGLKGAFAVGVGAAINNAAVQGISVATGLQDKFSFAGVAAAGVGAGIGDKVGSLLGERAGTFGGKLLTNTASAIANAATRSAIEGSSFGDNIIAAIPDVIGQAVGAELAAAIIAGANAQTNSDPVATGQGTNEHGVSYTEYSDGSKRYGKVFIEDTRTAGQITGYDIDAMLENQSAWGAAYADIRAATYRSLSNVSYTNGFFDRVSKDSFTVKRFLDNRRASNLLAFQRQAYKQHRANLFKHLTSNAYITSGQAIVGDIYLDMAKAFANVGIDTAEGLLNIGLLAGSNVGRTLVLSGNGVDFSGLKFQGVDPTIQLGAEIASVASGVGGLARGGIALGRYGIKALAKNGAGLGISTKALGNPEAIVKGIGSLNSRQLSVLEKLPDFGSQTIVHKPFRNNDLAALTAQTGDEFAMFTTGGRRLITRGDSTSVPINTEKAAFLASKGWRFSSHTHPGTTQHVLRSSPDDRSVLLATGGKRSSIYNSSGDWRIFTPQGDDFTKWVP